MVDSIGFQEIMVQLLEFIEEEHVYASAVLFAAVISLLVPYVSYRLSRRGRRKSLRQSLYTEISSMDWLDEDDLDNLQDSIIQQNGKIGHAYVPSEVYDSHIEDIGLLTSDERRPLIQYYQSAHIAQKQLESLRNDPTDTDLRDRFAYNTLSNLHSYRNCAESALSEHVKG